MGRRVLLLAVFGFGFGFGFGLSILPLLVVLFLVVHHPLLLLLLLIHVLLIDRLPPPPLVHPARFQGSLSSTLLLLLPLLPVLHGGALEAFRLEDERERHGHGDLGASVVGGRHGGPQLDAAAFEEEGQTLGLPADRHLPNVYDLEDRVARRAVVVEVGLEVFHVEHQLRFRRPWRLMQPGHIAQGLGMRGGLGQRSEVLRAAMRVQAPPPHVSIEQIPRRP